MHSLDEVFELFTDERRRLALYYLEEQDGEVPISELAETITEWEEAEDQRPSITDDRYRDVVIELEHKDLPKAAEAAFVEYDPEEGIIELMDEPREFQLILTVAEALEQPESGDDGISALL